MSILHQRMPSSRAVITLWGCIIKLLFLALPLPIKSCAAAAYLPRNEVSILRRSACRRKSRDCPKSVHDHSFNQLCANEKEGKESLLLPEGPFDPSFPQQRPLQNRRNTASNRKPRHYWKDIANIEHELREQWKSVLRLPSDENKGRSLENISRLLPNDQPPPIPNETLLTYWQRNDLANAIRNLGRPYLAYVLGGATVIPGRWKLAVQEPIVRCVVDLDENLTEDRSPPSRQQLDRMKERYAMSNKDIKKWAESGRWKRREGRRGKGFWSKEKVINLFNEYLNDRKISENLPAVWMPRLSQVEEYDRGLKSAILRYYGSYPNFCKHLGLVPYREWTYLERQHDLMISLKLYCDEHCGGDSSVFPQYVRLREEGYGRLFRLIQDYGGRQFVAARFGMVHDSVDRKDPFDLNWGPFDLEFGISLLNFVRQKQMELEPPLRHPAIFMPTQSALLTSTDATVGKYLDRKILEYGGYENVARRLGLEWQTYDND